MTTVNKMDHIGLPLAKAATAIGAATAVGTAGSIEVTVMLGYTLQEWQLIAIIIAAVSGIGGLLLTAIFKTLHYRLEVKKARGELD